MEIRGYQVIAEFGRGDTGVVYHVRDSHERDFALKIAIDTAPFRLEQMQQEAKVLGWLKHPSVPRAYDFFEHEGKPCLLMEYIKGESFDNLLANRKEPYTEGQVLAWAQSLAEVLAEIHVRDHIYSYLAPTHVILAETGQIYLMDYGKTLPYPPEKPYPALGLAGYSPPEQYLGRQEPRSDVFGLGVFMYQLATLRDPRLSHAAFLFHVLPPRELNPALSPLSETLILKAVEHKISERFPNMLALLAEISAARSLNP